MNKMKYRPFVAFVCAFSIVFQVSAAAIPRENTPSSVEESARQLQSELTETLGRQGTQSLMLFLRQKAESGMALASLRHYFFDQNHGQPVIINEAIPEKAQPMIRFVNTQLRLSGVDFIQFRGVIDRTLKLNEPLPSQARLYRKWVKFRTLTFPLLGAASGIFQAGVVQLSNSVAKTASAVAQALAVFGLEVNFSVFSKKWNILWSDEHPMIPYRVSLPARDASCVARLLGRLLDATRGVTRADMWNFLVNVAYTGVLISLSNAALGHFGISHPGAFASVGKSLVIGSSGFLAFGLSQVALGKAFARGELSELLRFQLETLIVGWGAFWRNVGSAPHMGVVGTVMLYSLALIVTAPLLAKTFLAGRYAQKTARLFAVNDETARSGESPCSELLKMKNQDWLGDFYGLAPFSKQKQVGLFLKQTLQNVKSTFAGQKFGLQ